ncbi:hypothetical protein NHF48_007600 [Sphingomonas sp. H160509]|uniref:hypothetical protein n=1 Tax=Sphingomonas sp. H160509 TaxID=2955313 RepID=UPI0021E719EE|nr:hypothetical protein [Sphingomonas sp. H160509]MDD1450864.1 hypothetical protein [Sphingomonas sp. H160509]
MRVSGEVISTLTDIDPALSPPIVIRAGSPPERGGVAPDPRQRRSLIQQAVISCGMRRRLRCQRAGREEPERTEPVIDRHDDDSLLRHRRAVIAQFRPVTCDRAATVDVEQHGQPRARFRARRRPDVERQAILADTGRTELHVGEQRLLHAARTEAVGFAYTDPLRSGSRWLPPQRADRCFRIGDAEIRIDRRRGGRNVRALNRAARDLRALRRRRCGQQADRHSPSRQPHIALRYRFGTMVAPHLAFAKADGR